MYWQGTDSICACFLSVNIHDEGLAFVTMRKFINTYLDGILAADNTIAINQRIQQYQQLLRFHAPELASHLHKIAFSPSFYAISWFMTSFARNIV